MPNAIQTRQFKTPVGVLVLGAFENQLCLCDWQYRKMRSTIDQRVQTYFKAEFREGNAPVLEVTIDQLQEYFDGKRQAFDIPMTWAGTDFQQQVWQALMEIPFGSTTTYMNLSKKLGNALAIRAVASANGANAISILVPCHRVIGSNGELVGYAGGLDAKKKLLQLENAPINAELDFGA